MLYLFSRDREVPVPGQFISYECAYVFCAFLIWERNYRINRGNGGLVNQHLSVHPNLVPPAIPRLKCLQLQLPPGRRPHFFTPEKR